HDHIDTPHSVFNVNDELKVMIIDLDADRGRISLSTKQLEPEPGDMINNREVVFEKAEEMAQKYREKMLAQQQGITPESMTPEAAETQDPQESQEPQEPQQLQEPQQPQEPQEPQEPQDSQESQEPQDSQESQEPQDSQESQEPQDSQESQEPQEEVVPEGEFVAAATEE
ncbi:MAG: S1 RNA-binding domain-containing protein, partial [Moorea sp. SIO4A3]|nr:S1 RNA-binding domain-containing protein [Moorena sp. SIO4A3]